MQNKVLVKEKREWLGYVFNLHTNNLLVNDEYVYLILTVTSYLQVDDK